MERVRFTEQLQLNLRWRRQDHGEAWDIVCRATFGSYHCERYAGGDGYDDTDADDDKRGLQRFSDPEWRLQSDQAEWQYVHLQPRNNPVTTAWGIFPRDSTYRAQGAGFGRLAIR